MRLTRLGLLLLEVVDVHDLLVLVVGLLDRADDKEGEREGHKHHDPAGEELVEVRRRDGVHPERARRARGLQRLVEPRAARERERVVRQGRQDPVDERLVAREREEVCSSARLAAARAHE